ncbi:MAG: hypothetical protein KME27_16265 [Lyngbya sp. HA4199-MV5]|nr:hypothetical protein [Lyngbya sp. HA4199-MV5]
MNGHAEIKLTAVPSAHTQASVLENLKQLREKIAQEVREFDQTDLPENLQTEIPKIAVLLQRIERLVLESEHHKKIAGLNSLICSLEVALSSLFQKRLSKEFTRQIRLDVEKEVIRHEHSPAIGLIVNQFFYIWHSKSVRLSVIYGLSWSFIIIFGGLFSLALIQYAAYSSNADTRAVEAAIDKKNKEVEELRTQIETLRSQKSSSILLNADKVGVTSDRIFVANAATITDLERRAREAQADALRIESQQEISQVTRHPSLLQNILSSIDLGVSKTLSQILWVAAAGTLGSIVSILIRVIGKSYDQEAYCDRLTPIFIGFFKPVIGASFGVLFLSFINSGVVSTPLIPETSKSPNADATIKASDNPETKAAFFLFSVAFVVGFSERLAKDTITKLEGGSQDDKEECKPGNSRIVIIRSSKSATWKGHNRRGDEPDQTVASIKEDENV